MTIETTVNVSGQNLNDEIGRLKILSIEPLKNGGIRISAEYQKQNGTPVKSVPKTYSEFEVDAIYAEIELLVTKKQPSKFIWECMSEAMIIVMANEFNINTDQIIKID